MNFPFFVARRYLFSKKSTHVINVISSISVIGVAVATMALVIVLSVFNGFHDLVATLFTSFDPQLKVVPIEGKTAPSDDPILIKIRQLPQVDVATETASLPTRSIRQECFSQSSSRNTIRIISLPLSPSPAICLGNKVCSPIWRFA